MSFCHGSVNCHLSAGEIYHFCESSKSVEIFTGGVGGGVGVGGHQHISSINHQLSCQCHCLYLVGCLITVTVAGPAAVIYCVTKYWRQVINAGG